MPAYFFHYWWGNPINAKFQKVSEFIQQRWGSWGIPVFAAWALILAFVALARLLFLSRVVELAGDELGGQLGVWLVFSLDTLFCIGFGLSAYGLWGRHNWGRLLFLWLLGFWSGFELIAPFLTNSFLSSFVLIPLVFICSNYLLLINNLLLCLCHKHCCFHTLYKYNFL